MMLQGAAVDKDRRRAHKSHPDVTLDLLPDVVRDRSGDRAVLTGALAIEVGVLETMQQAAGGAA